MIASTASSAARGLVAAAVLACSAALVAACGTSGGTAASPATATTKPSVNPGGTQVTASPAPAATTPPGPGPCATSALNVTIPATSGGAAAGSVYYPIDFTNVSGSSCTLYGYPGVSFVTGQGGSQIGPAATRDSAFPKTLLTLAPGQVVHAELQVADAQNYPPATCGQLVNANWLEIYPPNQTAPVYVSFTAQACSKSAQILSVMTVQTGASGA